MIVYTTKAPTFRLQLPQKQLLGGFLVEQVHRRFETRGRSGGVYWTSKVLSGGKPLHSRSMSLYRSFHSRVEGGKVSVYSTSPHARVHQLGTRGKGGVLPTIRPKTAKALFIPLTDRAAASKRYTGPTAAWIRNAAGKASLSGPIRASLPRNVQRFKGGFSPLRQGKIVNGRMMVKDESTGEWSPGQPDFIFLAKVDIAPRPMLPDSFNEKEQQKKQIKKLLLNR